MGYRNSVQMHRFEELSPADEVTGDIAEGDLIFVAIRNPKTVPLSKLVPGEVAIDPETGEPDKSKAMEATYEILAGLIVDWHVFDGEDTSDDPAPYPSPKDGHPATAAQVATLPFAIIGKLTDEIGKVTATPQ